MQPQSAKKITQLGERRQPIESALRQGLRLNEVAWTGLRNEVLKLYSLPSERQAAAPFLAAVYSFAGDVEQVVRFTKIALRLNPPSQQEYFYLQFACIRVGEFDLADEVERHSKLSGLGLDFNNNLSAQMQMGRFLMAARLAQDNSELLSAIHKLNVVELQMCECYMNDNGISDLQIAERLQVAIRCFVGRTKRPVFHAVIHPTPVGIIYGIPFDGSLDEGEELDIAMAEAVEQAFSESLVEHLSVITYPSAAVGTVEEMLNGDNVDNPVEA